MFSLPIAIDMMSGDRGLAASIPAVCNILAAHNELKVMVVGDKVRLLSDFGNHARVEIVDSKEQVSMTEDPMQAVRRKGTSLYKTIDLVKNKRAFAAVSAGNTGALMVTARVLLKMRQGYRRPAIASQMPSAGMPGSFLILDLGANLERTSDMLVDFAHMGSELATSLNINNPRVRLLNVGTEVIKGGQEMLEANQILEKSDLNYLGFIEANTLFAPSKQQQCPTDVVVCDGFTGNVLLKTSEGLSGLIKTMLRNSFRQNIYAQVASLFAMPVLNSLRTKMDPRKYNGAAFLGLRGLVVKSHGNADEIAFTSAINFAIKQASLHEKIYQ